MASPTLYFPFLPFFETQASERVARPWKPEATADDVRAQSSAAVGKALRCKPSGALC